MWMLHVSHPVSVYAHYSSHPVAHLAVVVPEAFITTAGVYAFLLLHF